MKEKVSVKQAIKRGQYVVNVPSLLIFAGGAALAFYLYELKLVTLWGMFGVGIATFLLAWLAWSILVTRWRIWAFDRVRNVHELKRKAIQEKIIWKDGSIFENTEIWTKEQRKKWKKLHKKFEEEDVYQELYSLPRKTEIKYSKTESGFYLVVSLIISASGIFLILENEHKKRFYLGLFALGVGLFMLFNQLKKFFQTKAPLYLSNEGIQTKNVDFKPWSSISGEQVIQENFGNNANYYLTYFYDDGEFEKLDLEFLDTSPEDLQAMLRTYRKRHDKSR